MWYVKDEALPELFGPFSNREEAGVELNKLVNGVVVYERSDSTGTTVIYEVGDRRFTIRSFQGRG